MRVFSTLAFLFLCATATAQEQPALLITEGGYYYIIVNDEGEPTIEEVDNVIDFRGDSPDPPTPPDGDRISVRVQQWAEEVNHPQGARALAVVYETVADNVENGTLSPDDAFAAIKQATDRVLDTVGGSDKWDGFRQKLGDVIVSNMQRGELDSQDEISKFLHLVSAGLDSAQGAEEALDPELIQLIIQLIIQIINLFSGDGGIGDGGPV